MLFNSTSFLEFYIVIFILYWFVINKNLQFQNLLLLLASYFFYACWDWRFLGLLFFSTFLDYYTGLKIAKENSKKTWLWISICINLGFLGFFKYYNFFADSLYQLLYSVNFKISPLTLNIVLPVGISFYTFHGLSYVIDIYRNKIKPERNFISYSLFVSFFPLLVAGPIERATHLLPQIKRKRIFTFSKATDGLRQILWGLFKKMVIADNFGEYANMIFNNPEQYSGSILFIGAICFALQIYGDFSGYTDIALGIARLLGIDLLKNFAFPYFSRDVAEFWRRWHISLSSWFRDYVYIPLGGSKGSLKNKVRNIFIIFLLSGIWHGANWTFLAWGMLNAIYFLPLLLVKSNRENIDIVAKGKILPTLNEFMSICITFFLTTIAWVLFRSESLPQAFLYLKKIFSTSFFIIPRGKDFIDTQIHPAAMLFLFLFFILTEWLGREGEHALQKIGVNWKRFYRWLGYVFIIFLIGMFAKTEESPFIYFQF